jgi:hypothetical protein
MSEKVDDEMSEDTVIVDDSEEVREVDESENSVVDDESSCAKTLPKRLIFATNIAVSKTKVNSINCAIFKTKILIFIPRME